MEITNQKVQGGKMQVSRSQPDLNFAHHKKEQDTENG